MDHSARVLANLRSSVCPSGASRALHPEERNPVIAGRAAGSAAAGPPPRLLTDDQLKFFQREGYLVVPALLPPESTEHVKAETWALLMEQHGMCREDQASWYSQDGVTPKRGGFVPLLNSQSQWDQRQHPLVHQVAVGETVILLHPLSL